MKFLSPSWKEVVMWLQHVSLMSVELDAQLLVCLILLSKLSGGSLAAWRLFHVWVVGACCWVNSSSSVCRRSHHQCRSISVPECATLVDMCKNAAGHLI